MARRAPGRKHSRTLVTLLACLSTVAVVQPRPPSQQEPRDLFFDDTPGDGEVVMARRGSDVVLDCQAIGTPIPTIHWLHRGRRVIQVNDHLCDIRAQIYISCQCYTYSYIFIWSTTTKMVLDNE